MCEEGYVFIMADSTNTLLENTSVPTLVHKFALPAILSNLVGSLYNIADQIFIGQKLGTVGNAATNIAFPLVLLMVTVYVTIGSSGSSKFSLLQGAGENESAGKAVALKIEAETPTDWKADGMDLQYINVTAVDKKGRPVWTYNEPLTLQIEGSARLVALDNSDHYTSDLFNGITTKRMHQGRMQIILRSNRKAGEVKLKVTSPGLKGTLRLKTVMN